MRTLKYKSPYTEITYQFEIGQHSRRHTPRKLYTNKASIGYALRNKVEFHNATGTFRALWMEVPIAEFVFGVQTETHYVVFSYNQVIASYNPNNKEVWINPEKYTTTTSRHQGMLWHLTQPITNKDD